LHVPTPPFPGSIPKALRAQFARQRVVRIDTWGDPLTYLTVRTSFADGMSASTTDDTWLPRTPASVQLTAFVAPAGYTREVPQSGNATAFSEYTMSKHC